MSSQEKPGLEDAIRTVYPRVQGFSIPFAPEPEEIKTIIASLQEFDLIISGKINTCNTRSQTELVNQLVIAYKSVVIVAIRLHYDPEMRPQVGTCLCCYSILEPSMRAVAKALFGKITMNGMLRVSIKEVHSA